VAIVQISQITNRKGLQVDLPQLAGAEFGWSVDSRRLFIGNGTLEEGAPVIGNTEILTQFSDIINLANSYTYKGLAAGYEVQTGPTSGTPVSLSLQTWLDQFASVLDFGAVGDGVTDDTEAINRALYQIYCREVNPQIRRGLFFPAGVYRVTDTIKIPPFATLWGDGADNSVILMENSDGSTLADYVIRTADSQQNTGVNIGNNGAAPPQYITVSNMGFTHSNPQGNVCLIQNATNCRFQSVTFTGGSTTATLTSDLDASFGVGFNSTSTLICEQITFDGCTFSNLVWGIYATTNNPSATVIDSQEVRGLTVTASRFDTLYRGVVLNNTSILTPGPGPTGARITGNLFDNIYKEGILFGAVNLNASGHNIFYDVGNHFSGSTGTPETSIISIEDNNNISISDLFERPDSFSLVFPRINLNNTLSIATTNGSQLSLGALNLESGKSAVVLAGPADIGNVQTFLTVDADIYKAFGVDFTVKIGTAFRTGTITITACDPSVSLLPVFTEDYVENNIVNVAITVDQVGSNINLGYYRTGNVTIPGTISYATNYLT
jgi:hypothetical protein